MHGSNKANDFIVFTGYFLQIALVVWQVLLGLLLLILLLGCLIAQVEGFALGEGIYFAFVTALTIGYGDIHAETSSGRALSVATGIVGMLFTGITVAVANRALHATVQHQNHLSIPSESGSKSA